MKRFGPVACVLALCLSLVGCGYTFPHVYDGPGQVIYMPDWENRTNRLGLDHQLYRALSRWFQKAEAVRLTKNREGAGYVLAGEIVNIDLPSVSWAGVTRASGVNVKLNVRYVLKDLESGRIVWEVPLKLYTASYTEQKGSSTGDEQALQEIVDELAEDIYMGTLHRIRGRRAAAAAASKSASPAKP